MSRSEHSPPDGLAAERPVREPGTLGIEEPRIWRTWQLAAAAAAALLLGMALGFAQRNPRPATTTTAALAGPSGASPETPTTLGDGALAPVTTGTTTGSGDSQPKPGAPRETTATSVGPSTGDSVLSTGSTEPAAPATGATKVLLNLRATGGTTTQRFTVGPGGWKLGWGFNCKAGGPGSFQVTILDGDGRPSGDAAVNREGASGNAVEQYTSSGTRYLEVVTKCLWAIKVVGSPG